jgi:hypothetical protein
MKQLHINFGVCRQKKKSNKPRNLFSKVKLYTTGSMLKNKYNIQQQMKITD